MKVTKAPPTGAIRRSGEVAPLQEPSSASQTAVVDEISVIGIPENELTPKVRKALLGLMDEVRSLRSELEQARGEMRELKTLADTDPLLGILNRRAFVAELHRSLALIDRYRVPASLVFIDLNDLKVINDQHGHAVGDKALLHVAKTLTDNIRQTDILGRLGGDEFGLLLTQTEAEVAHKKAHALEGIVKAHPISLDDELLALDIASGVVALSKGISAEEALDQADANMYVRKRQSRSDTE